MITINYDKIKQHYITSQGIASLRRELEELKQKRLELASDLRNLSSQNDVNSAMYDQAQTVGYGQASELNREIAVLEHIIAKAKIITKPDGRAGADMGSSVVVDIEGTQKTYVIVGSIEADPLNGKISNESPLGKSLLGKKVGDSVTINTVSRSIEAKVVRIA